MDSSLTCFTFNLLFIFFTLQCISFAVSRSNVKVTVAFYAKTMSAQYLEKFLSGSHGTVLVRKIGHGP